MRPHFPPYMNSLVRGVIKVERAPSITKNYMTLVLHYNMLKNGVRLILVVNNDYKEKCIGL